MAKAYVQPIAPGDAIRRNQEPFLRAKARHVYVQILYDGEERGLSDKALSVSYTDNDQGKSDEVSIQFENANAEWVMNYFMPQKEHDLDVTLFFENWLKDGDKIAYHCGNFTIDDISFSGPPTVCTIKGVSIPAEEGFQTEVRSRTWEKMTLLQIATEILAKYGITKYFYHGAEPIIDSVEQDKKSDSAFLYELCKKQGMFLKIYKRDFVIFDKKAYEPRDPKVTYYFSDLERWSWNTTLNGTYTGCRMTYTSTDKDKNTGKKATLQVEVGDMTRPLNINESASNEEEARRVATSRVNEANEKAVTVNLTMGPVSPHLYATENFALADVGRMNGKYFATSVSHNVTGGNYTMTVTGYKIFNRL